MTDRRTRTRLARRATRLAAAVAVAGGLLAGTAGPAHAAADATCSYTWSLRPVVHNSISVAGVAAYFTGGAITTNTGCASLTVQVAVAPVGGTPGACTPLPSVAAVATTSVCFPVGGTNGVALVGATTVVAWTVTGAGLDGVPVADTGSCTVAIPPDGANAYC